MLGCTSKKQETTTSPYPSKEQVVDLTGEETAKIYCGNCHLFPEPALLTKKMWKNSVLPQMGLRLGIPHPKINPYGGMTPDAIMAVSLAGVFPYDSMISKDAWEKIQDYYINNAPDSLDYQFEDRSILKQTTQFKSKVLPYQNPEGPLTTMLEFDSIQQNLWIGTATGRLEAINTSELLNENYTKSYSHQFTSPPTDILFKEDGSKLVLIIGQLNPGNDPKGKVYTLDNKDSLSVILDSLYRPVDLITSDLTRNQQEDLIISEFGHQIGNFNWYENDASTNSLKRHILKKQPGAIQVKVDDLNGDSLPDCIVLMAQGDEHIAIFYNEGQGKFRQEIVLRFPPIHGSNYFELVDFNNDGFKDILMTNGDNADYSSTAKPYHYIRIFLNNGKNQFTNSYQFPLFGASKAIAHDFDQDGDLDIAAIAFFNEYNLTPNQSFVYLENKASSPNELLFEPAIIENSTKGRWIVMEAADIDGDKDMDIILGALAFSHANVSKDIKKIWLEEKVNLLLIENMN